MSKQTINIGASPNDGTGTPLRTSFDYTNQNFTELYTALGGGVGLPGATTQVIFNDGGTNLAGDAGLVYNKTTDALTVAGLVTAGSATITGDLTVDTSTLKVDSTNNRVGIGTASPGNALHVQSSGDVARFTNGTNNAYLAIDSAGYTLFTGAGQTGNGIYAKASTNAVQLWTNGAQRYDIDSTGISTWSVGGSTAMTLNSTGLGIGASPTSKLTIGTATYVAGTLSGTTSLYSTVAQGLVVLADGVFIGTRTGGDRFVLDTSGNVGIGVTPSAWGAGTSVIDMNTGGNAAAVSSTGTLSIVNNGFFDGTNWTYKNNATALLYQLISGQHLWFTAGASTGTITDFATAKMTLDASGRLLVGTTTPTTTAPLAKLHISLNGTDRWAVGPQVSSADFIIQAATTFGVYLAGSSATSWSSASDERLKDVIEPISNAVSKVGSLRAVIGKFKSDKTNTRKPFLMAQDVLAVLPEAVDVSKPDQFGLAYTDVIPLLVAAIKELSAEVNALKNA